MDQSLTTIHTNANFRVRISGSASLRVKPYHALTSHCNNFLDSRSDPDNVDPDNVTLITWNLFLMVALLFDPKSRTMKRFSRSERYSRVAGRLG
jgi:hypothetical protein